MRQSQAADYSASARDCDVATCNALLCQLCDSEETRKSSDETSQQYVPELGSDAHDTRSCDSRQPLHIPPQISSTNGDDDDIKSYRSPPTPNSKCERDTKQQMPRPSLNHDVSARSADTLPAASSSDDVMHRSLAQLLCELDDKVKQLSAVGGLNQLHENVLVSSRDVFFFVCGVCTPLLLYMFVCL